MPQFAGLVLKRGTGADARGRVDRNAAKHSLNTARATHSPASIHPRTKAISARP